MNLIAIAILAVAIIVVILIVIRIVGTIYQKVGPNQSLIIYGTGGPHVITGGGKVVLPLFQRASVFSLELMSFDVAPQQDLYTTQGVAVNVEAVAQIKVKSDRESILTAAEQFLSKTNDEREGLIRLVMEGHLRGIVGQLTVQEIVKEPEMVGEKMRLTAASDLDKMGLEVVSFTIKEVRDKNDYIANMGRPDIARIQKEADIASALAERDTQIQKAQALREAAVARAQADQARVEAEAASLTKQAEFQRDLELKRAAFEAAVKKEKASADKAYDIQTNVMQQQVVTESVRVQQLEKEAQIKVQEAEIQRRELELQATILKAAEAERKRIQMVAEAERSRLALEAEGQASATKQRGEAEAGANRARGLAEADVIRAQGEAEAEAMRVKANAYREYNQAAVLDKLLTALPEVVRAIAEPLSKVDKVTIVSTGGDQGSGLGASRLTGDIVNMVAQVPALFEVLSGTKVGDLLEKIPGLADEKAKTVNGTAQQPAASDATLADLAGENHQPRV
jgi:flotillin